MFTRRYKKILICAALLLLIAAAVFSAASLSRKIDQDRQSLVENTIRNYAVQCYALEGFYPETLQYLEDNYTLELNRKQYVYHYRFIGSNMMPEISVFERKSRCLMEHRKHKIDLIFIVTLAGIFFICSITFIVLGANFYANTVSSNQDSFQIRTASLYFTQKIRQNGKPDSVQLTSMKDGSQALVLKNGTMKPGCFLRTDS